jgi:checkpoint serine/threonine-protein kinase
MHTRAATDDIYEIFNAPLKQSPQADDGSVDGNDDNDEDDDDEYDETDADYTTDAESTGTSRHATTSGHLNGKGGGVDEDEDEDEDAKSESEWSDFTARKHIPQLGGGESRDDNDDNDDEDEDEDAAHAASVEDDIEQPSPDHPHTRTVFVPVQPEDYDPPTRPFRDPAEVANNRLPFMTPITERTEVSLEVDVEQRRDQFKTPCKNDELLIPVDDEGLDLEPMSSPLRELLSNEKPTHYPATLLQPKVSASLGKAGLQKVIPPKGPTIKDATCNPLDEEIRSEILNNASPPLSTYPGFYHHRGEKYARGCEIRKYAKAMSRHSKASSDKATSPPAPVTIEFPDSQSTYMLKRELGSGAFAPVYLVENSAPAGAETDENDENAVAHMGKGEFAHARHRESMEALKMEDPPSAWEFFMMRVAHTRLGPHHRATASLTYAHEMHLYQDEAFLFLPFHPYGTLLDVVNLFRGEASGVMDEQLAMFFTIELLRTVEALHAKNIMHGDIKPDNCLLRLDSLATEHRTQEPQHLSSQWRADGSDGWDQRGITLIDFGRAIDMRAFMPDVQFIADWKTTAQDCAEMREGRPWTWQIDYHGLAGTIHCLLFGKYIDTVRCDQGGLTRGGRRYRIRESLKRYWQTDLWSDCFDMLLNPASCLDAEEGQHMPVLKTMRQIRERMEAWLEENCERGVGLKSLIARLESTAVKANKRN